MSFWRFHHIFHERPLSLYHSIIFKFLSIILTFSLGIYVSQIETFTVIGCGMLSLHWGQWLCISQDSWLGYNSETIERLSCSRGCFVVVWFWWMRVFTSFHHQKTLGIAWAIKYDRFPHYFHHISKEWGKWGLRSAEALIPSSCGTKGDPNINRIILKTTLHSLTIRLLTASSSKSSIHTILYNNHVNISIGKV